MRTNVDFTPFRRSTIGFDRLFDLLENGTSLTSAENYPPFDLEQEGEDRYRISLAVAGFREEEIDIIAKQNLLVVSGRKAEQNDRSFVHRGIATRSFERRFALGDYVQVREAELKDGLLSIVLVREIPEEMKPRKIEIGGSQARQIGGLQAGSAENENAENEAAA
ncbi:Hsp20 family protein [Sphingosinicella rhizophila]|uniref:Hsp20 family protein n=1 Tax=Sphingosinicella rhizophila TaxID=3050082 RepID=A0ABU3Q4E0_9SPHN|nr:Hsp20 family protein [Sphingosinicella sp. GR2756]MDT9598142.1 Hsp20 family protein [Sphingosinicella sp. GR2756]